MQYEEYKARMEKQGRKPVGIEDYEKRIEPAYMAMTNTDKDEFCALPDGVIADIRILANQRESARHAANVAEEKAKAAIGDLRQAVDLLASLKDKYAEAGKQLRRHEKLVSALLAELPAEKLRAFMLSMVDAN